MAGEGGTPGMAPRLLFRGQAHVTEEEGEAMGQLRTVISGLLNGGTASRWGWTRSGWRAWSLLLPLIGLPRRPVPVPVRVRRGTRVR
jgi:hypothetical protein